MSQSVASDLESLPVAVWGTRLVARGGGHARIFMDRMEDRNEISESCRVQKVTDAGFCVVHFCVAGFLAAAAAVLLQSLAISVLLFVGCSFRNSILGLELSTTGRNCKWFIVFG